MPTLVFPRDVHAAQASLDGHTCWYNCDVSPDAELVVVRPFARSDIGKLDESFKRWNEFPPCDVTSSSTAVKADLIL
jgi:hypothetical protein